MLFAAVSVAALIVSPSQGHDQWRCVSAPVTGEIVRADPFVGYVVPRYDVVGGRFRLHVGVYRDRASGLSQKIPWFVPVKSGVGSDLTISFKRLAPSPPASSRCALERAATSRTGGSSRRRSHLPPPDAGASPSAAVAPPEH